jgi:hypothetical protein
MASDETPGPAGRAEGPGPGAGPGTPSGATLALFRICTFPADTCNSGNLTAMRTEPAQIVTTGDG